MAYNPRKQPYFRSEHQKEKNAHAQDNKLSCGKLDYTRAFISLGTRGGGSVAPVVITFDFVPKMTKCNQNVLTFWDLLCLQFLRD